MNLKAGQYVRHPKGWLGHDIGRRRQEDNGIFSERRHKRVSHLSGRVRTDWGQAHKKTAA
jgi:hypothetical protein